MENISSIIMTRERARQQSHFVTNPMRSACEPTFAKLDMRAHQSASRRNLRARAQQTWNLETQSPAKPEASDSTRQAIQTDSNFAFKSFCPKPKVRKPLLPNGERYPLVGGTRQRHFAGTNLKPRELPENAQTPTSRVHAVLAATAVIQQFWLCIIPL
jgi:hypothetical protein